MNKSNSKGRKVLKPVAPSTAAADVKNDKGLALRKRIREVQLQMGAFLLLSVAYHVS